MLKLTKLGNLRYVKCNGSYRIPKNVSNFFVKIPEVQEDSDYTINVTLKNKIDVNPSIYSYIVTNTTVSGFSVGLSGDTDSDNYFLDWFLI